MKPIFAAVRSGGFLLNRRINIDITKLKINILNLLKLYNMRFREIQFELGVRNIILLDIALQELRKSGQIHYAGHKKGWKIGRGKIYKPNQR